MARNHQEVMESQSNKYQETMEQSQKIQKMLQANHDESRNQLNDHGESLQLICTKQDSHSEVLHSLHTSQESLGQKVEQLSKAIKVYSWAVTVPQHLQQPTQGPMIGIYENFCERVHPHLEKTSMESIGPITHNFPLANNKNVRITHSLFIRVERWLRSTPGSVLWIKGNSDQKALLLDLSTYLVQGISNGDNHLVAYCGSTSRSDEARSVFELAQWLSQQLPTVPYLCSKSQSSKSVIDLSDMLRLLQAQWQGLGKPAYGIFHNVQKVHREVEDARYLDFLAGLMKAAKESGVKLLFVTDTIDKQLSSQVSKADFFASQAGTQNIPLSKFCRAFQELGLKVISGV